MRSSKPKQVLVRAFGSASQRDAERATVRRDIACGALGCTACSAWTAAVSESCPAASPAASIGTNAPRLVPRDTIAIPDAATVLTNMGALENPAFDNVLVLGSVATEVGQRNRGIGARLRTLVETPQRRVFQFSNEHHEATHTTTKSGETPSDTSRRAIVAAAGWLAGHWLKVDPAAAQVVVVTSDVALMALIAELRMSPSVLRTATVYDFVRDNFPHAEGLLDHVSSNTSVASGSAQGWGQSYLPDAEVAVQVAGGNLAQGRLRVSESNCFYGDVRCVLSSLAALSGVAALNGGTGAAAQTRTMADRILISGRASMNRAVHDDIVAVSLRPVAEWRAPDSLTARRLPSLSEADALALGCVPTGHVVAIVQPHRRPYCGSVDMSTHDSVKGTVVFQPKSARIPRIRLHTHNAQELRGQRVVAVLDDWPEGSFVPKGHYIDVIGPIGDRDTEAKVILMERDVPYYEFSAAVYDCLPKGEWVITAADLAARRDLRGLPICSVDPLGCRDIDDALHYRDLPDGTAEIGVHIADVTHFVSEGSALDIEARKRSTSVYLVDRRINMLPQLLTENLCSIVGNEDRFAVSFIWKVNPHTVEILDEWFGKTIIRSKAALYYGDAQKMIDDANDRSELTKALRGLMRTSKILKQQRLAHGALELASQQYKFVVDNDHVDPTDMVAYKMFDTNSMVEEWMLAANIAAAKACYKAFPQWALLRHHDAPDPSRFDDMNKALKATIGCELDPTSSASLNASLSRCVHPTDPFFNTLVRTLTTRCLKQAQYFSSGDAAYERFFHYGLAMPIYTHFTSPIRRYADVVVHRQLTSIMGHAPCSDDHANVQKMRDLVENINYRHENAQKAGRDSQNLFSGFFLRSFPDGNVPDEIGYVVKVTDTHVIVFVPKYGQEGKVLLDAPSTTSSISRSANEGDRSGDGDGSAIDGDAEPVNDVTNDAASASAADGALGYTLLQRVMVRIRLRTDGPVDACAVKLQFQIIGQAPSVILGEQEGGDTPSHSAPAASHGRDVRDGLSQSATSQDCDAAAARNSDAGAPVGSHDGDDPTESPPPLKKRRTESAST